MSALDLALATVTVGCWALVIYSYAGYPIVLAALNERLSSRVKQQ